ncbi:hypothetical protein V8C86DRAFT_3122291 [Haematococcus lacustris]
MPAQPSPAQPSPAQPSPAQPSPAQPSPAQPSPAQPSPAQPSPAQPSPAQPSPAQPSPAQPSPAQPSPAQPSPAQPSPAQPSPAQPSPAQPSPAQPSPAQPSPAQPSPAQPSPAQPSPAQPSPAQPSPAQPSPAQPSPAQPSPAQPSPAQPSHGEAVAIIMEERGALAPDWPAELSGLLLNTTFTFQVMVVAVVGQQIIMPELGWAATGGGMHAFEVARHVEALSDSLLGALVDQDFPELFSRAQELVPPAQWEVVKLELAHLVTQHIDAMFKYLGAHGKVYLQLPHLLPALASSDATYAAHAARRVLEEDAANRKQWEAWEEQQQEERQQDHGNRKRMRRPLPPQSCNPAEYDLFNTISMFRADIEAMAANEACSPRLFMHLVHFFGAAPTSNAHVEDV